MDFGAEVGLRLPFQFDSISRRGQGKEKVDGLLWKLVDKLTKRGFLTNSLTVCAYDADAPLKRFRRNHNERDCKFMHPHTEHALQHEEQVRLQRVLHGHLLCVLFASSVCVCSQIGNGTTAEVSHAHQTNMT